jgi:hypothetical protein
MTLLPAPITGRCICGCEEMTLARDKTDYYPAKMEAGRWVVGALSHSEESENHDAVRLFCPNCGEYYQVPEEV